MEHAKFREVVDVIVDRDVPVMDGLPVIILSEIQNMFILQGLILLTLYLMRPAHPLRNGFETLAHVFGELIFGESQQLGHTICRSSQLDTAVQLGCICRYS